MIKKNKPTINTTYRHGRLCNWHVISTKCTSLLLNNFQERERWFKRTDRGPYFHYKQLTLVYHQVQAAFCRRVTNVLCVFVRVCFSPSPPCGSVLVHDRHHSHVCLFSLVWVCFSVSCQFLKWGDVRMKGRIFSHHGDQANYSSLSALPTVITHCQNTPLSLSVCGLIFKGHESLLLTSSAVL